VALNFLFNVLVLLFNHVNVTVKHVDVVVERIVLLLSLHESRHDFLNGRDARLFFNLLESILDDLNVPDVHIHKVLLLEVVSFPPSKAGFKESSRV